MKKIILLGILATSLTSQAEIKHVDGPQCISALRRVLPKQTKIGKMGIGVLANQPCNITRSSTGPLTVTMKIGAADERVYFHQVDERNLNYVSCTYDSKSNEFIFYTNETSYGVYSIAVTSKSVSVAHTSQDNERLTYTCRLSKEQL